MAMYFNLFPQFYCYYTNMWFFFCVLILHPVTMLQSLISSSNTFVDCLGLSVYIFT